MSSKVIPFFEPKREPEEWDEFFGPPIPKRRDGALVPQEWKSAIGKNVGDIRAAAPPNTGAMLPPQQQPAQHFGRAPQAQPHQQVSVAGGNQQMPTGDGPAPPGYVGQPMAQPAPVASEPSQPSATAISAPAQPQPQHSEQVPPPQQAVGAGTTPGAQPAAPGPPTMFAGISFGPGQAPVPYIAPFPIQVGQQVMVEGREDQPLGVVAFITPQIPPQGVPTLKVLPPTVYAGVRFDDGQVVPHVAPFSVPQGGMVTVTGGRTGVVTFITTQPPPQPTTAQVLGIVGQGAGPAPEAPPGGVQQPAPAGQQPAAAAAAGVGRNPQQFPPVAIITFPEGDTPYFAPFRIKAGDSVLVEGRQDPGTVTTFVQTPFHPVPGQELPKRILSLVTQAGVSQQPPAPGSHTDGGSGSSEEPLLKKADENQGSTLDSSTDCSEVSEIKM